MTISKARTLRKNLTDAERALWKQMRVRQIGGYKFRRQQPIGKYIVDFVNFEKRVIVELDGGHHSQQVDYDTARTAWLEAKGYRVFRFWNNQVLEEIEAVKEVILDVLNGGNTPHLNPLPLRERRTEVPSPLAGEG